jgi:ribonuclease-3
MHPATALSLTTKGKGAYHKLKFVLGLLILTKLGELQGILGITFKDDSLLQQSLIHRSYLNENPTLHLVSNERLEFLGDAVLGFVVANELYCRFPDFSEGELTNLRSALVRGDTLSGIALSLHLGDYLYLGHGEEESGGRIRPRNLSCVLEAIIGAVFVDQGFDVARNFTLNILSSELEQAATEKSQSDYKSRLQQIIQSGSKITPVYRTIEEVGPDHAKVFTVEVLAGDSVLGRGSGRSKRAAEMDAARQALEDLKGG